MSARDRKRRQRETEEHRRERLLGEQLLAWMRNPAAREVRVYQPNGGPVCARVFLWSDPKECG